MPEPYAHPFPSVLIRHVTSISGPRGVEWLDHLPHLIGELESKWRVTAGAPFEKGEFNFVAPAATDGLDAVLKIAPPYQTKEILAEAEFLRTRKGHNCVRLLAEDRDQRVRRSLSIRRSPKAATARRRCSDATIEVE